MWHDGIGLSLYAKRLHRRRFVWPVTVYGVIAQTTAPMIYLLEAIDWRNPQHAAAERHITGKKLTSACEKHAKSLRL
jgi:transposase